MILDGKHRLALAIALNLETRICIHLLPNTFAYHTFFRTVYDSILHLPYQQYARNQSLIREIYNES